MENCRHTLTNLGLNLSMVQKCVFVLKELIRYYIKHGSCVYVDLLDASKAFDRVNHTKLFSKLLELGVNMWIIKVLCKWYCNQSMCVRWGLVLSNFRSVNIGVRQGGTLSLLVFNVETTFWLLLW